MNPFEPDDPILRPLADWPVAPPRNPQFRARVWERIEGARGASSWAGFARAHAAAVAGALVVAIALGAVAGRGKAHARVAAESSRLATAYVQALDARNVRLP